MDALTDERGQAAMFVVLLVGIGALAIAGLSTAEQRIVAAGMARAAGEATVEAATSVVADAYADELRARAADPSRAPRDMRLVVSDPAVILRARATGDDIGQRNGGATIDDLSVVCVLRVITVNARIRGTTVRAGFPGSACSPP